MIYCIVTMGYPKVAALTNGRILEHIPRGYMKFIFRVLPLLLVAALIAVPTLAQEDTVCADAEIPTWLYDAYWYGDITEVWDEICVPNILVDELPTEAVGHLVVDAYDEISGDFNAYDPMTFIELTVEPIEFPDPAYYQGDILVEFNGAVSVFPILEDEFHQHFALVKGEAYRVEYALDATEIPEPEIAEIVSATWSDYLWGWIVEIDTTSIEHGDYIIRGGSAYDVFPANEAEYSAGALVIPVGVSGLPAFFQGSYGEYILIDCGGEDFPEGESGYTYWQGVNQQFDADALTCDILVTGTWADILAYDNE